MDKTQTAQSISVTRCTLLYGIMIHIVDRLHDINDPYRETILNRAGYQYPAFDISS